MGDDFTGAIARLSARHGLTGVTAVGAGVESQVLSAHSRQWGRGAVKLPLRGSYVSLNDPGTTTERLFRQEHLLLRFLEQSGFPSAPKSFLSGSIFGLPYVILEYLDAAPDPRQDASEVGRLLARLHRVPPPALELSAQETLPVPELIPSRLARRFDAYRRLSGASARLPGARAMAGALRDLSTPAPLLPLDVRSVNIIWDAPGRPKLIDWSNSLLGPPQLELARLAEIGDLDTGEVIRGYEAEGGEIAGSPESELIFRLDAAVMLAVVFLSGGAGPERVSGMVRRVDELAALAVS